MAPVADGPVVELAEASPRTDVQRQAAPLRVAVVADSPRQPRWLADAFSQLAGVAFARVIAVADLGASEAPLPWPWTAYLRLDASAFGHRPEPLERVQLGHAIGHERRISGSPEACRRALAELDLDVLFVLGDVPVHAFEGVARHGLWRWSFGSDATLDDRLAGLREVQSGALVTRAMLGARLGGEERLLCDAWTRSFEFSLARTRDNLLPRAAGFAAQALQRLHRSGEAWLSGCPAAKAPTREAPDARDFAAFAPRVGANVLRGVQEKRLEVGQWLLAVRFGAPAQWDGLAGFQPLIPPTDRFWADPSAVHRDGRHYVFFEELVFSRGRAHIAMMEVRRDGRTSAAVPVLEQDCHLSYPFVFEDEGELYMIPESGERSRVELYRCARFPDQWRLEKVLLEGAFFTDATVARADGRWWMFVNVFPAGTQGSDELHLYHAERLTAEWKPHPRNPLKCDVRGARPAGALYREGPALYRPAQIGTPIYGWGMAIQRVDTLTTTDYREREVMRIAPDPARRIYGVHTLNRAGDLTVIDAFTRRPRLRDRLPSFPGTSVRGTALNACP